MVRNYLTLNESERREAQEYTQSNSNEALKKELETKAYHYGEGVLFSFVDHKIAGSVRVVLEAIKHLNTAYIHFMTIKPEQENENEVASELIQAALNLLEQKKCARIMLGTRDDRIRNIYHQLGYVTEYHAFKLKLTDRQTTGRLFDVEELNPYNKYRYLEAMNQSFSDMPHGQYIEMEEVNAYLADQEDHQYYMVLDQERVIGFINTEVSEGIGSFDIGLYPESRGRGYGKILLETAIELLNKKQVSDIIITVIEKNKVAYEMYQKRGFIIDSVLSDWVQIK